MTSSEGRRILVKTLCDVLLQDSDPTIRLEAIESRRLIQAEEAIDQLCYIFKTDPNLTLRLAAMNATVEIVNPEAFKPMSDTPKYDLRGANIGSFAVTVQGDQISYQYNLAETADLNAQIAEIQEILDYLQHQHPNATETEASSIIETEFREIKQKKPWQWQNLLKLKRLWQGSKTAAIRVGEHFSEASPWGKAFVGFLEGISETED